MNSFVREKVKPRLNASDIGNEGALCAPVQKNMTLYREEGKEGKRGRSHCRATDHRAVGKLRAAPLVQAKVKITVKNALCPSLPFAAYGVFYCEFGFPSHEWSCS